MILSASAHMREMEPDRYTVFIDWKPALSAEQLDSRLLRDLDEGKNRDFSHILAGLLPRKSIPVFAALADIPLQKKGNAVTREERRRLAAILKEFPVRIHGFRPVEEAIVTAAGRLPQGGGRQNHGLQAGKRPVFCGRAAGFGRLYRRL